MEDIILNKIRTFIYDNGWGYTLPFPLFFKKKKITRDTTLVQDLKIDGDDSEEFLLAFSKEFSVDVSKLPLEEYFGDEGDVILLEIIKFFNKKKKKKKILTVGHLEKAIVAGRLDEEVIGA